MNKLKCYFIKNGKLTNKEIANIYIVKTKIKGLSEYEIFNQI